MRSHFPSLLRLSLCSLSWFSTADGGKREKNILCPSHLAAACCRGCRTRWAACSLANTKTMRFTPAAFGSHSSVQAQARLFLHQPGGSEHQCLTCNRRAFPAAPNTSLPHRCPGEFTQRGLPVNDEAQHGRSSSLRFLLCAMRRQGAPGSHPSPEHLQHPH